MAISGAGCASYSNVRFAPAVQDVELRDGERVEARLVVAWRGIRERNDSHELRFRMRLENPGSTAFTLAPAEFELVDAALVPFGTVWAESLPVAVEAGREETFDLAFPVPDGKDLRDFDLAVLHLRVHFQAGRWSWNTTFQRVEPYPYHDPYWDSPWSFHFGVFWCS